MIEMVAPGGQTGADQGARRAVRGRDRHMIRRTFLRALAVLGVACRPVRPHRPRAGRDRRPYRAGRPGSVTVVGAGLGALAPPDHGPAVPTVGKDHIGDVTDMVNISPSPPRSPPPPETWRDRPAQL